MKDMSEQEQIDIAVLKNDIQYIKENIVSKARFRPVELITYGLSGGVLLWALNQLLATIETAKALF